MQPDIRVYGLEHCGDTRRTRRHLDALALPYTYINLDKDDDADRRVREWNAGLRLTPTVVICRNGCVVRLAEPGNDALDAAIANAGLESIA